MNYCLRRKTLASHLKTLNIDCFLITNLENIFYLTGFYGTNAIILHNLGSYLFITDPRYQGQAEQLKKAQNIEILIYQPRELITFTKTLPSKVSIEDTLTLQDLKTWQEKAPQTTFTPQQKIVETLRTIKSSTEIDTIRRAQSFVDQVLEKELPKLIKEGLTEKALAFKLEYVLLYEGAHELSFPSIVAFGENSAIPHHQNSTRALKKGDNILIDCGIKLNGYCSDITRNFSIGKPSVEYQNKYEHLLRAQSQALNMVRNGAAVKDIAQACRTSLGAETQYFTHSLGHGVGIDIHEDPRISVKSDVVLEEHMIITIEPGLYYPEQFGIRIEDLIWVQKQGCEILSQCSKDLIIL